MTAPITYTVDEVAALLQLSRSYAYHCVQEGLIPAKRIGGRWVVPCKAFHVWLDGATVG